MERLQTFVKKYGGYFGIAGVLLLVTLFGVAIYLGSLVQPFNLFTWWVSSLGVGPYGAVFTVALVVGGLLFVPFALGLGKILWGDHPNAKISTGVGVIATGVSIVGAILAGLFNFLNAGPVHVLATNLFSSGPRYLSSCFRWQFTRGTACHARCLPARSLS